MFRGLMRHDGRSKTDPELDPIRYWRSPLEPTRQTEGFVVGVRFWTGRFRNLGNRIKSLFGFTACAISVVGFVMVLPSLFISDPPQKVSIEGVGDSQSFNNFVRLSGWIDSKPFLIVKDALNIQHSYYLLLNDQKKHAIPVEEYHSGNQPITIDGFSKVTVEGMTKSPAPETYRKLIEIASKRSDIDISIYRIFIWGSKPQFPLKGSIVLVTGVTVVCLYWFSRRRYP